MWAADNLRNTEDIRRPANDVHQKTSHCFLGLSRTIKPLVTPLVHKILKISFWLVFRLKILNIPLLSLFVKSLFNTAKIYDFFMRYCDLGEQIHDFCFFFILKSISVTACTYTLVALYFRSQYLSIGTNWGHFVPFVYEIGSYESIVKIFFKATCLKIITIYLD